MLIFVQATVKVQVTKNLFYNILTCTAIMDGFTLESVDVKGGLQDGLNHGLDEQASQMQYQCWPSALPKCYYEIRW